MQSVKSSEISSSCISSFVLSEELAAAFGRRMRTKMLLPPVSCEFMGVSHLQHLSLVGAQSNVCLGHKRINLVVAQNGTTSSSSIT